MLPWLDRCTRMDLKLKNLIPACIFYLFVIVNLTSKTRTVSALDQFKWFAYCHLRSVDKFTGQLNLGDLSASSNFDSNTFSDIEILSCGRCYLRWHQNRRVKRSSLFNSTNSSFVSSAINVFSSKLWRNYGTVEANPRNGTAEETYSASVSTTKIADSNSDNLGLNEASKAKFSSDIALNSRNNNQKYCAYYYEQAELKDHPNAILYDNVESNSVSKTNNQREVNPLLPNLTNDWLNDLFKLIDQNRVRTNLVNFSTVYSNIFLPKLAERLKIIELVDFKIEYVHRNAFKQFSNLRVLRMPNNYLQTIELSSFAFDEQSAGQSTTTDAATTSEAEKIAKKRSAKDGSELYNINLVKELISYAKALRVNMNSGSLRAVSRVGKISWNDSNSNSTTATDRSDNSSKTVSVSGSSEKSQHVIHQSPLIELDLSMNKLTNIKLENFMYLENLRILNFSYNFLKYFDLRFITIVSPRLQALDLSYNQIRKFKIIENYIYSSESPQTPTSKPTATFKVISAPILSELSYLNLNGNQLHDFNELFSINPALISDKRFCNKAPLPAALRANESRSLDEDIKKFFFHTSQRSLRQSGESQPEVLVERQRHQSSPVSSYLTSTNAPFNLSIKNNSWYCDCRSFEIISSIIYLKYKSTHSTRLNTKEKQGDSGNSNLIDSCYLNSIYKQNSFIFKTLLSGPNFEMIFRLNCTVQTVVFTRKNNWLHWYNRNCVKDDLETGQQQWFKIKQQTKHSTTVNTPRQTSTRPQTNTPFLMFPLSPLFNNFITGTATKLPFFFTTPPNISSTTTPQRLFITNSNNNNNNNNVNLLNFTYSSRPPILKYDFSTAFYWISSICIAVVTLSCLFFGWFHCWKRYRLARRLMFVTNGSNHRSHHHHRRRLAHHLNLASNRASRQEGGASGQTADATYQQRRASNVYLLNSRLSNVPSNRHFVNHALNTDNDVVRPNDSDASQNNRHSSPLYRNWNEITENDATNRNCALSPSSIEDRTTIFYSMPFGSPRNVNRNPLFLDSNNNNTGSGVNSQSLQIQQQYSSYVSEMMINNLANDSLNRHHQSPISFDDEPPNYYEAIMYKQSRVSNGFITKVATGGAQNQVSVQVTSSPQLPILNEPRDSQSASLPMIVEHEDLPPNSHQHSLLTPVTPCQFTLNMFRRTDNNILEDPACLNEDQEIYGELGMDVNNLELDDEDEDTITTTTLDGIFGYPSQAANDANIDGSSMSYSNLQNEESTTSRETTSQINGQAGAIMSVSQQSGISQQLRTTMSTTLNDDRSNADESVSESQVLPDHSTGEMSESKQTSTVQQSQATNNINDSHISIQSGNHGNDDDESTILHSTDV